MKIHKRLKTTMPDAQKPIFLSHSYHDKDLANHLSKLLINGCDVSPNDILFTSSPGKDIKVGEPSFIDYLKKQLASPKLVILLITENYLASSFCLAELGASWRMGFECFPLAVNPIARNEIGGVLEVTQAGDISQENYLDQLRDKVRTVLGKEIPTAGWTVEKDVFLGGLDALIKGMKKPDLVQRAEFEKAQGKYKYAVEMIKAKEAEISKLSKQIDELKALKDAAQVKAVAAKYSSSEQQFNRLQGQAQSALKKLCRATRIALYWRMCDEPYNPEGRDAWNEVETAKTERELWINEGESASAELNDEHPRVQTAETALRELKRFLEEKKQEDFVAELTEEDEFPIEISNKEFWRNYLANVD
jgi:hypothetical protein